VALLALQGLRFFASNVKRVYGMHLGRFHAVVSDLVRHINAAKLIEALEEASSAIGEYAGNRDVGVLSRYRGAIDRAKEGSGITDPDLLQPFAQQVIEDLGLSGLVNPDFSEKLNAIVSQSNYDPAGLSEELKKYSETLTSKMRLLRQLENSLDKLDVEFERVGDGESEIGFLLPRTVVGNKLGDLSKEFDQLNRLARAIAEISGDTQDYEPDIRTIASSWWQVFLDLTPEQICIWVFAIERIVSLFKSNLEIKSLSNQLREQKMPPKITRLIEEEIDKRVKAEISKIAADIKKDHSKRRDQARMNELEIQLRQSLIYLAKRLNQGMRVEVNLAIPDDPETPVTGEDESVDQGILRQIELKKLEIAKLTDLRDRALAISREASGIDEDSPLLIETDLGPDEGQEMETPKAPRGDALGDS